MCLLASISSLLLVLRLASGQPILPLDEVNALEEIAATLGKSDWNFNVDPCSGLSGWIQPNTTKDDTNSVTCDCKYANSTVCHVVSIALKAQNLNGTLPPELVKLPYLREIDLTRNYLNGTIPKEWGSMNLVNISLLANRLTGPIPKELGNISTLANLTLDYNQLTGSIPPEFGNLSSIEKLVFTSNNLSGTLPETLAKLTTMKDFRISDNFFSGSIPTFIENWINIEKLIIQGSGLTGPIPSGIASLTKLTDLRISDLNGIESTFPNLSNITNLENLILRSCNIVGKLPPYIGEMKGLKVLDLSFNNLSGPIPENYAGLKKVDFIYLTGNFLTGQVPPWMISEGEAIDLSYNNFTSEITNCQPRKTNLFASSKGNASGVVQCLKSSCQQMRYSLHINCGGRQVDVVDDKGTTTYEEDVDSGGPSKFYPGKANWAFSSTGNFLDDDNEDSFIHSNISTITGQNSQLYMDARVSPMSLTYYGFCMRNGKYNVMLHFAEIMFTDDRTYASLGRRIFDVYIQGQRVLKDFNIEDEAGGINKGITRNFPANIIDNSLDIRLYWAGKGTNGIPVRGVYGPLISAISVSRDFKLPSDGIPTGAIVGIVLAVLLAVTLLVLGILWWKGCLGRRDTLDYDLKGLDLNTGLFTLRQIKGATNNFDPSNKIGEGGFGPVYKGLLPNGTIIAVKQLSSKSKQGNREFVNEIGMISALQHPHLVKLHGCCIEGNQLLLIYEYMENNSLARALFGLKEQQLNLDWPTRHKICIGLARGLAYLHEESRLKIVHRDIKATNVLLDKDLNPKISDFGLAKLDDEDNTHISTRIAGTYGYMAPEYAMRGYLTDKADVYSFGVVLLEIVSGRSNTSLKSKEDTFYLLDWAHFLKEKGDLMELVDPRLFKLKFNKKEVMITINIALHCANAVASERPAMSAVVSILEGRADIQEFVLDSSFSFEQIDSYEMDGEEQVILNNGGRGKSVSMDVPWTGSSSSATDLYPLSLDSSYWEKKS